MANETKKPKQEYPLLIAVGVVVWILIMLGTFGSGN
jgi:hypothetical protein